MKPEKRSMLAARVAVPSAMVAVCLLCSCVYDVPITPTATRKIDRRLIGDWSATSGKEKLRIRSYDDSTYVFTYDGALFRAFHSDVAQTPFVSVQDIDSSERKYLFVTFAVEEEGRKLTVRSVSKEVIPEATKSSKTVQELLQKNLKNPDLYDKEVADFKKD